VLTIMSRTVLLAITRLRRLNTIKSDCCML
jgi:hypothetical protein